MKICLLSDTHGRLPVLPPCDLILHAGDLCPNFGRYDDMFRQPRWIDTHFRAWREYQSAPFIGTAGNHDFAFQRRELIPKIPNTTFLLDEYIEFQGLKIYASPYSLRFYDWAFMAAEDKLDIIYSKIPEGLDFLIVHGPPLYLGNRDRVVTGDNVGSEALRRHIERALPKHVVTGHIHEARGISQLAIPVQGEPRFQPVTLYNASCVDLGYNLHDEPYFMVEV